MSSLVSSLESFYEFIFWEILDEFNENNKHLNFFKYMADAYKSGLGFTIITDKEFYALALPKYSLNSKNQIHKDFAPAIIWPDGEKEYWLNGIKMPEDIVIKNPEEINPKILLKEPNVEIRREIVRKIGIERICQKLNAKTIDSYKEYELLILNLEDKMNRPYLKMKNPSTGTYHLEGVPLGIKSIREALNWRNQTNLEPSIIT